MPAPLAVLPEEGAVGHVQRAKAVVVDAAAVGADSVTREGAVDYVQRAIIADAAAIGSRVAASDGQVAQRERGASIHLHHTHRVISADGDALPRAVNGQPGGVRDRWQGLREENRAAGVERDRIRASRRVCGDDGLTELFFQGMDNHVTGGSRHGYCRPGQGKNQSQKQPDS